VPRAWVLPFDDLAVLKGTYARLLIYTPIWTSPVVCIQKVTDSPATG